MSDPFSRPSNADFLKAINATKFPNLAGAVPAGYEVLYTSKDNPDFALHGLYGVAYLNRGTGQIITAFDGPVTVANKATAFFGGEDVDPVLAAAAIRMNQRIAANDASVTTEMDIQVAAFNAEASAAAAAKPGGPAGGYAFTKDNVFVTGNSGGALLAQLSARANGYDGVTYGGVPIPGTTSNNAPDNSGLYNYYRSLDPVGNIGTDRASKPQQGKAFHYGKDVEIGPDNPVAGELVATNIDIARNSANPDAQFAATAYLLYLAGAYHGYLGYAKVLRVNVNRPQATSVDLDSMPDAVTFLRNADAIDGAISWDANNVPTITLRLSDGSTSTMSVDALSSGQYLFLYTLKQQSGQQRVSGVQFASNDQTGESSFMSEKSSTYNDNGALEKQEDVFANGTTAIKYLDPRNTHPFGEVEIEKDATGKVTAAKPKIDGQPANTIDFSVVGQVLGSALGRALAPNNQFGQIAIGTVAGAVGQKLISWRSAATGFTWRSANPTAPSRRRWPTSITSQAPPRPAAGAATTFIRANWPT